MTDETPADSSSEAPENSGIVSSDPGWTDDLLERARERSASGRGEPDSMSRPIGEPATAPEVGSTAIDRPLADGSVEGGSAMAASWPYLGSRADLEGEQRPVSAASAETSIPSTLPAEIGQSVPEVVDLGIPDRLVGARRTLIEWGAVIVGALALALLVRTFLFGAYYIPTPSMEPTLSAGDRIIVNKVSYRLHDVNRGDLVVFSPVDPVLALGTDDLIKRVIGLPGETVMLDAGRVIIDGGLLLEPYLSAPDVTEGMISGVGCIGSVVGVCTVPAGHVFVMGDNRGNSRDSRFFGPVPIDSIAGRAFIRVWPLRALDRL